VQYEISNVRRRGRIQLAATQVTGLGEDGRLGPGEGSHHSTQANICTALVDGPRHIDCGSASITVDGVSGAGRSAAEAGRDNG